VKALKGLMKKVSKGEGGFTLIELLIVIIILGILAAVVAFNVGGFLGAGTCETAKTEMAGVQTAIIAGMADISCGTLSGVGSIGPGETTKTISCAVGNFSLETYLKLPTHGNWTWGIDGVITNGTYEGGGKTATYNGDNWTGTACE
jgi:prepilin-type N-terminal cleavage/methylation domain-containing protein